MFWDCLVPGAGACAWFKPEREHRLLTNCFLDLPSTSRHFLLKPQNRPQTRPYKYLLIHHSAIIFSFQNSIGRRKISHETTGNIFSRILQNFEKRLFSFVTYVPSVRIAQLFSRYLDWQETLYLNIFRKSEKKIRVCLYLLTLRRLMSYIYIYIYGAPILDVSRSHATTQHSQ